MSRQFSFSAAVLFVSLTVVAQSSLAQSSPLASKARRQERALAGYQLRAPAAEAIAEGRIANGKLAVAALIGKLQANGDLRKAETEYAEVCLSTGQRKFDAQSQRAVLASQQTSWMQAEARERDRARYDAAQARARQVRQGEWPRALRNEVFRPLREELASVLGNGSGLVATAASVDYEQAVSIVAQMRRLLLERRAQTETNDHIGAKKFLDELKALANEKPSADAAL